MGFSVNKVVIAGVLVEDPQLRRTTKGFAVCNAQLEVRREWVKDGQAKEEVSPVEVDVFGKNAENLCQYLKLGDPVMFEGHLKLEQWTDQSGQACARMIVVADSMQFIPTGNGNSNGGSSRRSQSTAKRPME